jgi:hypothetical protein
MTYFRYTNQLSAQEAITQVRTHRPLSIQTTKQVDFIHTFEEFTRSIRLVYDESSPSLPQVLSRQRKYLHGPEVLALRHVPKIIHVTCERLNEWCATHKGEDLVRELTEEEIGQLARYKGEVDEGKWEGVAQGDGVVIVRMLLDWLCQLSPRLLHESAEDILGRKSPPVILSQLSESARRSLVPLITTLHKMALPLNDPLSPQPGNGAHTLYSAFAKALVPLPKSKKDGDAEQQLLDAIAFLRDVNL